jgi:hypothetical protein
MQILRVFFQHKTNPLCVKVYNTTTDYINKHGRDKVFQADMEGLVRAGLVDVCKTCGITHAYEDYSVLREEIV